MHAASKGHLDSVQALIAAGADLEYESQDNGFTGLMIAARAGHSTVVRALIAAGANLEHRAQVAIRHLLWRHKKGMLPPCNH